MDFKVLPKGPFTLKNLAVPACYLGENGDLRVIEIGVEDGRFCKPHPQAETIDMRGAMAFAPFIDMHTHLDKGHIWPRAANPDGSFDGAIAAVQPDRQAHWSAQDLRRRMDFALRCAYAHGTGAIRTHLDSAAPQDAISWPVFREMREDWSDRITLQAVCLVGLGEAVSDPAFAQTADIVAQSGGVLGCATYPIPDPRVAVRDFLSIAQSRGLAVDMHVDETADPSSNYLRLIAETVLEMDFDAPVSVGHCCSLAMQDEAEAMQTIDLVAKAGLNVVSLPMCNMYLQDRRAGCTPRWRGITLVHEMVQRGINVSFASDNTRDPFYAYGDLDMIEVMREATRIAQLDHSSYEWARAFGPNPAQACGFESPGFIHGQAANLVICRARNWTELLARPQSDRIVLRSGRQIDRTLPDFAELDPIML
ncbi:cytosine deaminase [Sulfitobacter mediterraneus]|uniref:Cytosine deaminase n=1 Tax=Sulfitobacter mediterraneus TaxID=83219 RepID=A0A2T6CFX5_9RHOB|nr:cytosine deaminase [Sulfitobacter mediterraneus]KIN77615.1 Amidohydrolase family [Sulfitobacter mediterraneus KCTC 32188]PTX74402.1 cytosine deaminase [Sulfitobacter mediterraneus]